MKLDIGHLFERSFALFTPALILVEMFLLYKLIEQKSLWIAMTFILAPIFIPLIIYRLVTLFFPIKEGVRYVGSKGFDAWVVSYRLQGFYYLFPSFERVILGLGLYSWWLRAWGSKVGKNVIWAPNIEVVDRGMMEIGDYVLFGYQATIAPHIVLVENGSLKLILAKVKLAPGTLVGGKCVLGPGTQTRAGELLKGMKPYGDYSLLGVKI